MLPTEPHVWWLFTRKHVEWGSPKWLVADSVFLWVLISPSFLHPSIFLSPQLPISYALSPGLDTLSLRSLSPALHPPPPPPPLCPGPLWVINYSWACSEGPGLLIPAHRGLALIQPVVQLNWKPSYTSHRHAQTQHARTHTGWSARSQTCHPLWSHINTHICSDVQHYTWVWLRRCYKCKRN